RKLAALRAAIFSINIKKRRFSEIIMKIVAFIRSQNIYVPTPFFMKKAAMTIHRCYILIIMLFF
ncbi:IS5/IS1182 family transposase, partial [Staphylococcus simulans]